MQTIASSDHEGKAPARSGLPAPVPQASAVAGGGAAHPAAAGPAATASAHLRPQGGGGRSPDRPDRVRSVVSGLQKGGGAGPARGGEGEVEIGVGARSKPDRIRRDGEGHRLGSRARWDDAEGQGWPAVRPTVGSSRGIDLASHTGGRNRSRRQPRTGLAARLPPRRPARAAEMHTWLCDPAWQSDRRARASWARTTTWKRSCSACRATCRRGHCVTALCRAASSRPPNLRRHHFLFFMLAHH